MSDQMKEREEREEQFRRGVIAWLRDIFENGNYRLINRGGATPSRDYYLEIKNTTGADLRELRMQVEIYKDDVKVDQVTAKTGASGIKAGEKGQLAFFTAETFFSGLKILPETVSYKTDWIPDVIMTTQKQDQRKPKIRKKPAVSESFRAGTGDLLKDKKNEYVRKLEDLKAETSDEEIRSGLERLIPIIEKIFRRVEEVPGSETEIKRLTDRYLPMIINSAESYMSYAKKEITGDDMDELKADLISGLQLVTEACGNLLNRLYEDGIVDAQADISVLKMLLKQDGLLSSDFKK